MEIRTIPRCHAFNLIEQLAVISSIALLIIAARGQAQTTLFNGVQVPGVVITHSPASSELYVGTPSLAILPNGDYVASRDVFGPTSGGSTSGTTHLFKSTDQGQSWSALTTISGNLWSGLFVYDNDLYLMGPNRVHGDMVIRRSTDGGATWTTPTNSSNGLLKPAVGSVGAHTSAMPVVIAEGRIWRAYEDNGGPAGWPGQYRAGLMSAPLGSNLLNAANWTYTNLLTRNTNWLPNSGFNGWLEGNAVVDRSGKVVDVLRVDVDEGQPEYVAIARAISSATMTFNSGGDIVPMSGGAKKFVIRYDAGTDAYWTLANMVNANNYNPTAKPGTIRNIVALMRSHDLTSWNVERIVLQNLTDVSHIGFQYLDWQLDNGEIVAVSRTGYPDGLGGADTAHNANFLTFHRFGPLVQTSVQISESFDYASGGGLNGRNGGTGWGGAWVTPTSVGTSVIEAQDIAAPVSYFSASGNQALSHTDNAVTVRAERTLYYPIDTSPGATQVLYGSMLFRRDDATNGSGTENSEFFRLDNAGNVRVIAVGQTSGELLRLVLGNSEAALDTTTPVPIGVDYQLVVKMTLNPSGVADVLQAQLFEAGQTLVEPSTWQGTLTLDLSDVATKFVINQARLAEDLHFDEIRISTDSPFVHPGDANADGQVNLADLQILGDNWQSGAAQWSQADFTGDGVVNLADLQIIGDNWGFGAAADIGYDEALQSLGLAVPEPASLLLILPAWLLLSPRRAND
ncbi:MAG: hypothetical protein IT445_19015 [Phycisphaeraceae bacterium]|nr:hypothetical protein [Phycisphaeraceae bacterium]